MTAFKVVDEVVIPRFGLSIVNVIVVMDDSITIRPNPDGTTLQLCCNIYMFGNQQIYEEEKSKTDIQLSPKIIHSETKVIVCDKNELNPIGFLRNAIKSSYGNTQDI